MSERPHAPWAEQDGDGMWEPACLACGLLTGPPFDAVLQRYNTEEEAFAAAGAVLSMMPNDCLIEWAESTVTADEEYRPSRREVLIMESQRAWLRRVKQDALWFTVAGTLVLTVWLIVLDRTIGWGWVSVGVIATMSIIPLYGVGLLGIVSDRLREVDRQ
jgi:hypothetical protein